MATDVIKGLTGPARGLTFDPSINEMFKESQLFTQRMFKQALIMLWRYGANQAYGGRIELGYSFLKPAYSQWFVTYRPRD